MNNLFKKIFKPKLWILEQVQRELFPVAVEWRKHGEAIKNKELVRCAKDFEDRLSRLYRHTR